MDDKYGTYGFLSPAGLSARLLNVTFNMHGLLKKFLTNNKLFDSTLISNRCHALRNSQPSSTKRFGD